MGGDIDHQPALPLIHDVQAQERAVSESGVAAPARQPPDQHPARLDPMASGTATRTTFGPDGHAAPLDPHQPVNPW
jgi:hypothetical protein